MAQIFHPSTNTIAKLSIVGAVLGLAGFSGALYAANMTYGYKLYIPVTQPVQFSHKHHVTDDGIDCRYCHTSVDKSSFAGLPPTETCMTCHSQIWSDSPELEPVRESWRTGQPIVWKRVHDLPDFVYFNHSIHVNKGVGCVSCHGQIDQMPEVYKAQTLTMAWCLDCHAHPENHLRPIEKGQVYDLRWKPSVEGDGVTQASLGQELKEKYHIMPKSGN